MGYEFNKIIMNIEEIKKCIPHRDPLIIVEAVHELNIDNNIITSKLLTSNDPVFAGHFPNNPYIQVSII